MEKYRKLKQIGEGASGIVFLAAVLPAHRRTFEEQARKRLQFHPATTALQSSGSPDPDPEQQAEDAVAAQRQSLTGRKRKKPSEDVADVASAVVGDEQKDGGDQVENGDMDADADADDDEVRIVAIKKIRMRDSREGISMDAVREIKLVQELGNHPYLVTVFDIFNFRSNVNIVMEYMLTDLDKVIKDKAIALTHADIKQYMRMILVAVEHCHSHWILHRDLKPLNLLVSENGQLKLGDFGIAKLFGSPDRRMTNQACTLWYRAPELLYGARHYGAAMDMWSVGCIFGELMLRMPMFPGTGEINQLSCIFNVLGTPKPGDWPDVECLPGYVAFKPVEARPLTELFAGASADALDLLSGLLALDPNRRPTARQALEHAYFRKYPAPTPIAQLRERLRERVRLPKAPRPEQLGADGGAEIDSDDDVEAW